MKGIHGVVAAMGALTLCASQALAGDCKEKIAVTDDSLEPVAVFSTRDCFIDEVGRIGMRRGDAFMRGFVHKKTGAISYQLYAVFEYDSLGPVSGWRHFQSARYEGADGPRAKPTRQVFKDVKCRSSIACDFWEEVTVDIEADVIRGFGKQGGEWRYRLVAQSGPAFEQVIGGDELASLRELVEAYAVKFQPPTSPAARR